MTERGKELGREAAARSGPGGPFRLLVVLQLVLVGLVAVLALRAETFFRSHDAAAGRSSNGKATAGPRTAISRPGPWGELECTSILIEIPDEFILRYFSNVTLPTWHFKDFKLDRLGRLLEDADLPADQREKLLATAGLDPLGPGVTVSPSREFILGMTLRARRTIYLALSADDRNAEQAEPFRCHEDRVDEWFDDCGLSDETVALVKRMLYRRGPAMLFSDTPVVLLGLSSDDERVRLIKTLSRSATLLVKLNVTARSDIDGLVNYWGGPSRAKDLRPLFESLAKVPGGCKLDASHLLSSFGRKRLYTYPFDPITAANQDCYWTAMNFFSDTPDDRFVDPAYTKQRLDAGYYRIFDRQYRFGDLLFVMASADKAAHVCVYIADDIVFTKNGPAQTSPWILMRLKDLMVFYPSDGPMDLWAYRLKAPATAPEVSLLRAGR